MANPVKALRTAPRSAAVTPDDDENLPGGTATALLIAVGGDLHYTDAYGEVTTVVPAGLFPVQVVKVFDAGTSATGITALYEDLS